LRVLLTLLLWSFAAPAYAVCAFPDGVEGEMVYNTTHKVAQFCNGTHWISMAPGSAPTNDPRIGMLANGKWCTSDGASVNCTQDAPEAGLAEAAGDGGQIQFNDGSDGLDADVNLYWDNVNKRLGIGTAMPDFSLHVASDATAVVAISQASGNAQPPILGFRKSRGTHASPAAASVDDPAGQIDFNAYNDAFRNVASIAAYADTGFGAAGTDTPGRLVLSTTPDGSSVPSPRLAILSNGNVGIGTTTPGATLDVAGNLHMSGHSTNTASLEIGQGRTGNGYANIDLHGDTTYTDYGLRVIRENTGPNAQSSIYHRGTGPLYTAAVDAAPIVFATSNAERLRIDPNGNVGIGTMSPDHPLSVEKNQNAATWVEVGNSDAGAAASTGFLLSNNGAFHGYVMLVSSGATPANTLAIDNQYNAPIRFATNGAQRMTILGDGKVGVGTASPSTTLELATANSSLDGIRIRSLDANEVWLRPNMSADANNDIVAANDAGIIFSNGTLDGAKGFVIAPWATGTKGIRITQDGNVGIGTENPQARLAVENSTAGGFVGFFNNTNGGTTGNGVQVRAGSNTTGGAAHLYFTRPDGTLIGSIVQSGATSVAYNTTSDRRLKENIVPTTRGLDTLLRVDVRDFSFKADPNKTRVQGFIAQELFEIYPEAVTRGGEDANQLWSVDYGRLTPLVIKAIQELKADNDNLRAELKAARDDLKAANDNDAAQNAALDDLRRDVEALKTAR